MVITFNPDPHMHVYCPFHTLWEPQAFYYSITLQSKHVTYHEIQTTSTDDERYWIQKVYIVCDH